MMTAMTRGPVALFVRRGCTPYIFEPCASTRGAARARAAIQRVRERKEEGVIIREQFGGQSSRFSESEVSHAVAALGPWFHNLQLNGVSTAPDHFLGDYPAIKWSRFSHCVPQDLRGWTVLDIGCNGGFYSIEMKRRGADRVVGVDTDPVYLRQAEYASAVCNAPIELRQLSVYEIGQLKERFDLVIFMGVLYHLRHPLLALDLLYEHVVDHRLLFQSMVRGSTESWVPEPDYPFQEKSIFNQPDYPVLHFVENSYSGDPTNWWIPNTPCVEAMLRNAGFEVLEHPEEEVFWCSRGRRPEFAGGTEWLKP